VYCQCRDDNGLHRHGGWLHFVGEFEAEIDNIERIGERFLFWLIPARSACAGGVRGQPVVQLEFVNGASPASSTSPNPSSSA
jgi:hypothetical protein